jgi:hypothetical protein
LLLQVDESCRTELTCSRFASLMLLEDEPVPLAELPVAELPVPEVPLPVPPLLVAPEPPDMLEPRIRPRISTWLFAYLVRFSCCVPATRMNLSPLADPLVDEPVPDVAEPLVLDPVAEPLALEPVPLVPELVPPDIEADPLLILAFVRTNWEPLALLPVADPEVAEPVPEVPLPDVPVVPAVSPVFKQPVTVTCSCVLELDVCGLLEPAEPDCALNVAASAVERIVPNTTLRFIYTS